MTTFSISPCRSDCVIARLAFPGSSARSCIAWAEFFTVSSSDVEDHGIKGLIKGIVSVVGIRRSCCCLRLFLEGYLDVPAAELKYVGKFYKSPWLKEQGHCWWN